MKNKHLLLIAIFCLVSFQFILAQQFEPVWETPFNPMNIYVTEATYNGEVLGTGDEIGIFDLDESNTEFCVGSIVLQEPIQPGEFTQVICSMDDGIDPDSPNGFQAGHSFIFKYWANESLIEPVEFTFPYEGYDEIFTPLGTAIVELLSSQQEFTQTINLVDGWNSLSSYLTPSTLTFDEIFDQISSEFIILQNFNGLYYPTEAINTLDLWIDKSGYFIKVTENVQLEITGNMISDKTVEVYTGWNLIPILSEVPVEINVLFGENLSKIEIIQEAIGTGIFWPEKEIFTLQNLYSGKSYLLKVTEDFQISF